MRAKLKNNSRKKFKLKYLIYIIIIYLSFVYTFYYSMKDKTNNTKFINYITSSLTYKTPSSYKVTEVVNDTIKLISKIDITNPKSILNTLFYTKKKDNQSITHEDDYSNLEELKKVSFYMEDPNKVDINNPVVYIYNTHQLENYNNTNLEIYNITPNVLMASYLLKEKLNKKGISTIVEDTNITNFLQINNWDYSESYKATRILIMDKKTKYNSLKYFIDLHRDSVGKKYTKVTIEDKDYAKIMFVVGLEHKDYAKNLETAEKLNKIITSKYPTISRGIYKKQGKGVDGIYNQDISPNTILIELGGIDNTIEEVLNTIEVLTDAIKTLVGYTSWINT